MQILHLRRARAQGMTEYIIIVGLVAILLVGVVQRFSGVLDTTIQGSTKEFNEGAGAGIQTAAAESYGPEASSNPASLPGVPGHPDHRYNPSTNEFFRNTPAGWQPTSDPR